MFTEQMLAHGTPPALVSFLRSLHTDVTELGEISSDAHVNTLALCHVISVEPASAYPDTLSDAAWTRPVKESFDGDVVMGHDLMHFRISGNQAKRVPN
jgi:ribonuclease BN (tRNA processing enzyme)